MPLYFFDVLDQGEFSEDDVGIECRSLEDVRKTAIDALPDIAKSVVPRDDHRTISVTVRDETGTSIFRASLTLDAGWLGEKAGD
ncbi:DUF6894 family protein [Aurantimonas coralicida]|uniref:DUF6894 family protein n=1 Tax=Aurantimonas coralicida TaxID=182270 RepID=UPI000462896C|nr:hypothetical protein [Aurantimonas coralicida]